MASNKLSFSITDISVQQFVCRITEDMYSTLSKQNVGVFIVYLKIILQCIVLICAVNALYVKEISFFKLTIAKNTHDVTFNTFSCVSYSTTKALKILTYIH